MRTSGCIQKLTPFLLLLVLNGCATLPIGPGVTVLPAQGKPFDVFRTEDATCRQWAKQQTGLSEQNYENEVAAGAVAGTLLGTGLGAAIGSASGHAGAGALIGGASGLLIGTAAGSDAGRIYGWEAQRRYDNAYVQCMYSYGNQVPGYSRRVAVSQPQSHGAAPPPPSVTEYDLPSSDAPPPPPDDLAKPEHVTAPSEIYIDESPQFIYSPSLGLYVAVEVPYDLVYTGTEYFYFYGGRWYRGPYYNGPWVLASRRYFPPVLFRYRIDRIRYFRDMEFRRYDHDREHFNGQFHRPEFRGERRKIGR